jgi:hypothetical protein
LPSAIHEFESVRFDAVQFIERSKVMAGGAESDGWLDKLGINIVKANGSGDEKQNGENPFHILGV